MTAQEFNSLQLTLHDTQVTLDARQHKFTTYYVTSKACPVLLMCVGCGNFFMFSHSENVYARTNNKIPLFHAKAVGRPSGHVTCAPCGAAYQLAVANKKVEALSARHEKSMKARTLRVERYFRTRKK